MGELLLRSSEMGSDYVSLGWVAAERETSIPPIAAPAIGATTNPAANHPGKFRTWSRPSVVSSPMTEPKMALCTNG